jgi:hypothetical protein
VDDADEFHAYVASVRPDGKNDAVDAGQLPIAKFRMPEIGRSQSSVVESPQDVGAALEHFLGGDVPEGRSFARLLLMKVLTNPWITANVERALDETPERLVFDDGSNLAIESLGNSRSIRPIQDDPDPVDVGGALLEPVTDREFGQIETLLQHLWDAAANESLTAGQEAQILAIAQLIEDQHRDTTPGETERWKLVGVVRGGLRYLAKEAPKDVLAWWKIAELLAEVNWTHILPG